jgi:hypothetical protein
MSKKPVYKLPLSMCEKCFRAYKDWEVTDVEWKLIPVEHQGKQLCERCYTKQLKKQGIDTIVKITHRSWNIRKQLFSATDNLPDNMMHVYNYSTIWGRPINCEVSA